MSDPHVRLKWNYCRRAVGVAVCFAPVVLLVASLLVDLCSSRESWLGITSLVGLAVGCLTLPAINFYLSFIRPMLYRWRHGSFEGMRNISGGSLLGTMLIVLGAVGAFGDWRAATIGLFALAIDTGGSPWFVISTWRDNGFWDE